jgi:putative membrane protein
MIIPKQAQLRRMLQYVGFPLLGLLIWDILVVLAYQVLRWDWIGSSHIPLALFGSVVGLIVGFRNNFAYARWWEARTLWGQIVNNSRSLGRQVCAVMGPLPSKGDVEAAQTMRREILYHQIAYVHALRQQLRGLDPIPEVRRLLPADEASSLSTEKNIPLSLQLRIGNLLQEAKGLGWIDMWEWQAMDRNVDDLADAQGGAERIKNTPMPKQYDYFPTLFVNIYCLMLPIGMVENLGWYTPLGSTLVGFMFLALDKIGSDLQNPFANAIFDVPLTAITRTIETNLRQMLGEHELPAEEVPIRGVLW